MSATAASACVVCLSCALLHSLQAFYIVTPPIKYSDIVHLIELHDMCTCLVHKLSTRVHAYLMSFISLQQGEKQKRHVLFPHYRLLETAENAFVCIDAVCSCVPVCACAMGAFHKHPSVYMHLCLFSLSFISVEQAEKQQANHCQADGAHVLYSC